MIRLVDSGWGKELIEAMRVDASKLTIICPFIKAGALDRLLSKRPKSIQVITRFNLSDFAEGVSDISALRNLLESGASLRGVRNLHAKLYIFGASRAIVTSANLTEAAINRNHEFGMVAPSVPTCL
jgi:phosphatidylserine/phosphatidylglycerophosphate/cardiolipin synthase-like enzyme